MIDAGVFAIMLEHGPAVLTSVIRDISPVPAISPGSVLDADGNCLVSTGLIGYGVFRKLSAAGQFTDMRRL